MKKSISVVVLFAAFLVLTAGTVTAENLPGTLSGEGTHFEITDSVYLNITVDTTETVTATIESIPETINISLMPVTSAANTQVTVGGLEPDRVYYKYVNSSEVPEEFTTDSSGQHSFVQDLPDIQFISIRPNAEEGHDTPIPGTLEGMHFEFPDSYYLKLIIDSSDVIRLKFESAEEIINMHMEPVYGTSVQLTLSGLAPGESYYKYGDGYTSGVQFTADSEGAYTFTQDLSAPCTITIEPNHSTLYIRDDATGGDCTVFGIWDPNTRTCTFTSDVNETIMLYASNITLEGNGHSLSGGGGGYGIRGWYVSGVNIQNLNISNFAYGIQFKGNAGNSNIVNNTFSNIGGIGVYFYSGYSYNNVISNNTFTGVNSGIEVWSFRGMTISNNSIEGRNAQPWIGTGISVYSSRGGVSHNTVTGFDKGIYVYRPLGWGGTVVAYNVIENNGTGFHTWWNAGYGIFRYNSVSNNGMGHGCSSGVWWYAQNNNFVNNATQSNCGTGVGYSGNYWYDYDSAEEGCFDSNSDGYCDAPYRGGVIYDSYPRTDMVAEAPLPINMPPVADAGPDRSLTCDSSGRAAVTLDGSGSYDTQDEITLAWAGPFGEGSNGVATGSNPTVSLPEGEHEILLVVDDARGLKTRDAAVYTVNGDLCLPTPVFERSGETIRVSVDSNGNQANNVSYSQSISRDGRYVAFASKGTNLGGSDGSIFLHDNQTGETRLVQSSYVAPYKWATGWPVISGNGQYVAFIHLGLGGAKLKNVETGQVEHIADSYSKIALSNDARFVAFATPGAMVSGDTNGFQDIYLRDRLTGATEIISIRTDGGPSLYPDSDCYYCRGNINPSVSDDGMYVAFQSTTKNLVDGDTNRYTDIFIRDRAAGATRRISVDSFGNEANGPSQGPSISADGRYVVFQSTASNLVPGDINNSSDVFIHDLVAGTTERVSLNIYGGQTLDGSSGGACISPDGRYVLYSSSSTTIIPGDTNDAGDVFMRDLLEGTTEIISLDSSGNQVNGSSGGACIDAQGKNIVFGSYATNLVLDDTNGVHDIFVRTTVVDTTPPALLLPANITAEATGPDGSEVAFEATADDLVDGVFPATCSPPSGATFALGAATVACSAVDLAGNQASGSFTVTVVDTTPPDLSCPAGISVLLNASPTDPAITAFLNGATAADIVDMDVTISHDAPPAYDTPGPVTVTFTAADDHANSSTCSAAISVEYGFGGFLQPVSLLKPFKFGSTAPVKFQLTDANGVYVSTAHAELSLVQLSGVEPFGDPIDGTTNVPDSGNIFRYDAANDLYIYNLATDRGDLSVGTWRLIVTLDDGTTHDIELKLK